MIRRADTVVIGGGVIGTAVTYYLTKSGINTILVERRNIASETTGAGGGLMGLHDKQPGLSLRLGVKSVEIYKNLEQELDYDIGYRGCGGLVPIFTEDEYSMVKKHVQPLIADGLPISFLDGETARYIEPELAHNIMAASFCPLECQVDPIRVAWGFANAAKRLGATVMTQTEVISIKVKKGKVEKVVTDGGEIIPSSIVNAAGVWSPKIAEMVGLEIPVIPRKGQIVVFGPFNERFVRTIMHGASYFGTRYEADNSSIDKEWGITFASEQRGPYVRVGVSRQFAGFDRTANPKINAAIIREAISVVPLLKKLKSSGAIAGLRPYTPDHMPILGCDERVSNFIFATGHEGEGITMAPMTGVLISELIAQGKTSLPVGKYAPTRFQKRHNGS